MATIEPIPAGTTLDFDTNLSKLEPCDKIKIEFYKAESKDVILKFMYPLTAGYLEITKDGSVYSFTLTATQTEVLDGIYGFEITKIIGTKEYPSVWEGSYLPFSRAIK